MAGEYNSNVKFESRQAEQNIDRFARRVGALAQKAKEAKTEAAALGKSWSSVEKSFGSVGASATKAANGILSFSRSANTAASAARGLIGSLNTSQITAAGRAVASLATATRGLVGPMRDARSGAGSLATALDRADKAARTLRTHLQSLRASSQSAARAMAAMNGSSDPNKIATLARTYGNLVGSFRAVQSRTRQFRGDMTATINSLTKMGPAANGAAKALDRLSTSVGKATASIRAAIGPAASLGIAMQRMAGRYAFSVSGLGAFANAQNKANAAASGARSSMNSASNATQGYANTSRRASAALSGMAGQLVELRNLAYYYITGLGIRELAQYADSMNLIRARLSVLNMSYGEIIATERRLLDVSMNTRTGYEENAKLFTKLSMAGKTYGVNAETSLRITDNVAKAMKISGASASESAAATQQLAQAFSSGKIQGDELRSVLENSPRLAQALATELSHLGINLGNVRDKASEGKIGIKELVQAFGGANITRQLAEEFNRIPLTMGDALTRAKTRLMVFVGEMDRSLGITPKVVSLLEALSKNFDLIAIAAGAAAAVMAASYIPTLTRVLTLTRTMIATNLASYFVGIGGAATKLSGSMRVLTGSMVAFNSAQGLGKLGAARGIMAGLTGSVNGLGRVVSSVFLRWPPLLAAVAVAATGLRSTIKPIGTESATVADYMVTGFDMAVSKIGDLFTWLADAVSNRMMGMVERSMGYLNILYKGIKMVIGTAADAPSIIADSTSRVANMATGGAVGTDRFSMKDYKGYKWSRTGLLEDFGTMVDGSEWNASARDRANQRWLDSQMLNSQLGPDFYKNWTTNPSGSGIADSATGGGPKKKNKGMSDAEREAKRLAEELKSLKAQLDPVEAARQKFAEGVDVLSRSLKAGTLSAADYGHYLRLLAQDTFPDLKDKIEEATAKQKELRGTLAGASPSQSAYDEVEESVRKQLEILDGVVKRQGDATGEISKQRAALFDQLNTYRGMVNENDKLSRQADARVEKERQIIALIDDGMNRLQETLTKGIETTLNNLKGGFDDLFKTALGSLRSILASYLGGNIMASIQTDLRREMEKAFGLKKPKTGVVGSLSPDNNYAKPLATVAGIAVPEIVNKVSISTGEGGTKASVASGGASSATAANDNGVDDVTVIAPQRGGFIGSFVSGYKSSLKDSFSVIKKAFEPVGKLMLKGAEKLGLNSEFLGKTAGRAFGGAQVGSATNDVLNTIGIKSSSTGAQIGGAIGGATGLPGGALIGSLLGGITGGLFEKTKKGGATVTGGYGEVSGVYGTSKERREQATGAAYSVQDGVRQLAQQLGGGVGSFNVSIGTYKDRARVNENGRALGGVKNANAKDFGDDMQAAIAYAITRAVKQGAITGLSETSTRILKQMENTERAIQLALSIENVKRQASAIRDPIRGAFDEFNRSIGDLRESFKEAGASASDWSDLNLVIQKQYDDIVKQQTETIRNFLTSLKTGDLSYASPANRMKSAGDTFADYERRIASGDFSFTQEEFTEAGQKYQALARERFGSTPEFAEIQKRLIEATQRVLDNAEATAESYKPVVDALNKQTEQIANDNQKILEELRRVNGGSGSSSTRRTFDDGNYL